MPFKSILDLKEEKTSSYTILEWYNCQSVYKRNTSLKATRMGEGKNRCTKCHRGICSLNDHAHITNKEGF
jgi:hypothetical protein